MIDIDGSTGEGGGQILRTALALSMCTGHPITIWHIRARRPRPGLMRQHLTCVQAAVAVCGARVQGAELGSQHLVFTPDAVRAGAHEFNLKTAVGCARQCRDRRARQGARTQQARACKDEQRRMARRARRWRAHSALTQMVRSS